MYIRQVATSMRSMGACRLLISAGQQSQYRISARAAANEPPESEDLAASQNAVDNDEARPGDEISESELGE